MDSERTQRKAPETSARPGISWPEIGTAALILLAYWLTSRSLLDQDVFVMGEIAQRILQGETLYTTAWDNKPPLSLLIYVLPQLFAFGSYGAVQLLAGVMACLQGFLWLKFAPGDLSLRRGGAFLLAVLPLSNFYFAWMSSEDTSNLFVMVLLLCAYRTWHAQKPSLADALFMGAMLVLAFHARQTTAVYALVIPVAVLGSASSWAIKLRQLCCVTGGALAALAAVVALVACVGDLQAYWTTVFVGPRSYVGSLGMAIDLVAEFRADVTALLMFAAVAFLLTRPRQRWFALTVAATAIACILSPLRDHQHYWEQIIPPLVLLLHMAGMELAQLHRSWTRLFAVVVPAFVLCNALWVVAKCVTDHAMSDVYAVTASIESQAQDGDRMLAVGHNAGALYFATRIPAANTFFWDFYPLVMADMLPKPVEQIVAEYEAAPPEVLVIEDAWFDYLQIRENPDRHSMDRLLRSLLNNNRYQRHETPGAANLHFTVLMLER